MVIIGGGYIACEFASIFNGFGTEVSIVYRGDRILRGFDNDIRESIKLIKDSIDKGIFNELVPQFWWEGNQHNQDLANYGIRGIPLAPDILFLISDEEKKKLEDMLKYFEN